MKKWLDLYKHKKVISGLSALECVDWKDEWLCEAYMETDYSSLCESDFQETINNYFSSYIKNGDIK